MNLVPVLLLVGVVWIALLMLVISLCAAAARGDADLMRSYRTERSAGRRRSRGERRRPLARVQPTPHA
jgi:hypothetical protein